MSFHLHAYIAEMEGRRGINRKRDVEYIVMRYAVDANVEGHVGVNIHIQQFYRYTKYVYQYRCFDFNSLIPKNCF